MLNVSTRSRPLFPLISCYFSKIASNPLGSLQGRRLGVEREFSVLILAVSYLPFNGGGSRFKKHESLGKQTTHDTYYNCNTLLLLKGVYNRLRNGHWSQC
jgi:hypothetical protein